MVIGVLVPCNICLLSIYLLLVVVVVVSVFSLLQLCSVVW